MGKILDDELYRVFCLLIEQIETLEKQNKSLKQEIQILQEKTYFQWSQK